MSGSDKSGTSAREKKKAKFLEHFEGLGTVSSAAKAAGISRDTAYRWRKEDAEFAEGWDHAEEETTERLEREAYRRATEGVERTIYQGGKEVGTERRFSDRLTEFLLKARRPEVYRERISIEDERRSAERDELRRLPDEDLDRKLADVPEGENVTPISAAPGNGNGRRRKAS